MVSSACSWEAACSALHERLTICDVFGCNPGIWDAEFLCCSFLCCSFLSCVRSETGDVDNDVLLLIVSVCNDC